MKTETSAGSGLLIAKDSVQPLPDLLPVPLRLSASGGAQSLTEPRYVQ